MNYQYIDTHCHLNFKDFQEDADQALDRSLAAKTAVIIVGSETKTSKRAIDRAQKHPNGVYAAIGLHPIHLEQALVENHSEEGDYAFQSRGEEFNYQEYLDLGKSPKVVAIGEVGLDYYHLNPNKDADLQKQKQKEVFIQQLDLAQELNLPVIIHCREAHDDLYPLLQDYQAKNGLGKKPWGVIHCFSGDLNLARKYIDLGLLISFTGIITFSHQWDEVIKEIPLEKMMIETDSPYLTPVPLRGKRNEPAYVQYVAKKIGEVKGLSQEEVGKKTTANAQKFFRIR